MAFLVTNDHIEIRRWIEENGGRPAVIRGSEETLTSLSIKFGDNPELEDISWDEFFDAFETGGLSFRYSDKVAKGNEDLGFNFLARDAANRQDNASSIMPEDNEMFEDNMFPSAANDHGQAGADEDRQ